MAINSSEMRLSTEDMAQAIRYWLEKEALYARDQEFDVTFETMGKAIVTFRGEKVKPTTK